MRSKKGFVVSKSGDKTIIVEVETSKKHPKYQKRYVIHQKYHVHDEKNEYKVGDSVTVYETRPLSALKRWTTEEPTKK
ncbi:MAG: 30S ribosomal protein S17 [Candidatus Gracilibacteria bacterium]